MGPVVSKGTESKSEHSQDADVIYSISSFKCILKNR